MFASFLWKYTFIFVIISPPGSSDLKVCASGSKVLTDTASVAVELLELLELEVDDCET